VLATPGNEVTDHPQYLTFFVAGEEYGLGILRVREIIQFAGLTRIPRTPAWVRGVLNLRGAVVPVVDIGARFGLSPTEPSRSTCIIVAEVRLEGEPVVMGLLADSVSEVVELRSADVQPPPAFGTRVRIEHLQGVGRLGERLVLLLDVDRLLSTEELDAAEALGSPASIANEMPDPETRTCSPDPLPSANSSGSADSPTCPDSSLSGSRPLA
jgi:purine-binding chemotaxis protein CheW